MNVLCPKDIKVGSLVNYDAIIGLEGVSSKNFSREGWTEVNQFFVRGGKYVGYGKGGVDFCNSLGILKSTAEVSLWNNGIVNLEYNNTGPITGSYPSKGTGFVYDPVYFRTYNTDVQVLASYSKDNLFMAGYWPLKDRTGFAGSAAIIKIIKLLYLVPIQFSEPILRTGSG